MYIILIMQRDYHGVIFHSGGENKQDKCGVESP